MQVAVLVSGGVDSSVALALLKQQGHAVTAFYLKIWLEDELSYLGICPWQEDLSYVQAVCAQLEVPLQIVSLQKEYFDHVVAHTIAQVKAGRTPNPDILCNSRIKFGMFVEYMQTLPHTYDAIASGHYAQVALVDGIAQLYRAPDEIKDQTYFLSYLTQQQLAKLLFPIGHLRKEQVRELAEQFDLPNKIRKDSQGICFLGKLKFSDFIKHYLGERPGDLIEYETGAVLGRHNGFWYYTIGQRQGIGLSGGPWYVVAKDTQRNEIFISRTYHDHDKQRNELTIAECNWIAGVASRDGNYLVKLRHGPQMHHAHVQMVDGGSFKITLANHDQGIASGQFAVIYDGQICIGAGIIV
ncbi:MAG TPA: tRNA 2-thiouridine(34) synthase MnmA [Candidatus Babeliales bacterium]|nr:tRNA 2-thiouridine(34) synthase MnmA [Candidatus Babeliales bacterium]